MMMWTTMSTAGTNHGFPYLCMTRADRSHPPTYHDPTPSHQYQHQEAPALASIPSKRTSPTTKSHHHHGQYHAPLQQRR